MPFSIMDTVEQEGNLLNNKDVSTSYELLSPSLSLPRTLRNRKSFSDCNASNQMKKTCKKLMEVQNTYLNKKVKIVHQNLETIYESPVWRKGTAIYFGKSKVKRSISLNREFRRKSKQKVKLQKKKIERFGKSIKTLKVSDDEFRNKMLAMDNFIFDKEQNCKIIKSQEDVQTYSILNCSGSPKKKEV